MSRPGRPILAGLSKSDKTLPSAQRQIRWEQEKVGASNSKPPSPSPPVNASKYGARRRSSKLTKLTSRFSKFLSTMPNSNSGGRHNQSRSPSIIRDKLPIRFQKYANPVHSSYGFWKTHVLPLEKRDRRLLETQFICKIFIAIPGLQHQLIENNLINVGQRVFSTIQWLLRTLYKSEMSKLIQRMEGVTTSLKEVLPDIDSSHVSLALHIFHDVFADYFGDETYALQIRASFERLLSMAVDIAEEEDFLAQETKIQSDTDFDNYMQSVESCLHHPLGKKYLQLFMRSQWNEELFLFHQSHSKFKASYGRTMIEMGGAIMAEFIEDCSPNQINISHDARLAALDRHNNDMITSNMFDEAFLEVMTLLKGSIWKSFSRTMKILHGDESAPKVRIHQLAIDKGQHSAMNSGCSSISDITAASPWSTISPSNSDNGLYTFPIAKANTLSPSGRNRTNLAPIADKPNVENAYSNDSPPSSSVDVSCTLPLQITPESPRDREIAHMNAIVEKSKTNTHTISVAQPIRLSQSHTLSVPRLSGSVSRSSVCRRSQELSQFLTPRAGWMAHSSSPKRHDDFIPMFSHQTGQHSSSMSAELFILTPEQSEDGDNNSDSQTKP